MSDLVSDTYRVAKSYVAGHVLASALAGRATNPSLLQRVVPEGAGPDSLFNMEFREGEHASATINVGHAYDQAAGVRRDAEGNELQCCSLTFNVAWRDRANLSLEDKRTCLALWTEVAGLASELQALVDRMGPTWSVIVTAAQVRTREATRVGARRRTKV